MTSLNENNDVPIIGILCIDVAQALQKSYGMDYKSYIAASYVKYLESAGAKVIPIWNNRSRSYYEDIMKQINGILLPGGAVFFNPKDCTKDMQSDCVKSSKYIYDIAKELNDNGVYFPIWGTCMGFQLMLTHAADVIDIRQDCKPMNCWLSIKFEDEKVLEKSKLFSSLCAVLKQKMSNLLFGYHFHRYCITKEDLRQFKIAKEWTVLASNEDENYLEFISIIENNKYPFFGAQIHPERVMYENFDSQASPHHSADCFEITQYFAKFFIQQCSLNHYQQSLMNDYQNHSIHNFKVTNTALTDQHWRECYLFKANDCYLSENLTDVAYS